MADARLITFPASKSERYTEHEWEAWVEDALATYQMKLLLLRYVEVEHLLIHIPVWRNVVYTCLDRLIQQARRGASNPARSRGNPLAACHRTAQQRSGPMGLRPAAGIGAEPPSRSNS